MTTARVIFPHQLFVEHLAADPGTLMVLVEPDLFFRQLPFHTHKLVLHRATMRAFAERLASAGFACAYVATSADTTSDAGLADVLTGHGVTALSVFDVVDDWLERDLRAVCRRAGVPLTVLETPGFLTSRAEIAETFGTARRPRMQHFYERQRRRLDVLMDGDRPAGGRWSFDTENRRRLPRDVTVPAMPQATRGEHVRDAIAWVGDAFPDNPGDPATYHWPTTHRQAETWLTRFLEDRFAGFGPYEDAIAADEPWLFHSALSPLLNVGLLDPRHVVERAVAHAEEHRVDLPSVEGFVRQVIGWREYMRASYVVHGRAMRTRNLLGLTRELGPGWWDGTTGLEPVDTVVRRVLRHGYAHHIERLMVLGNAMLLLRTDPDEVYEWFMTLFVDAYDWVMVPNVYAMSQFAAGELVTTKPYVSGSNYLRKMSDFGTGPWCEAWDALYWQFVADHRQGFESNPRSGFAVRTYDRMDDARKRELAATAAAWLGR
ncbi:cryptochrome/photolyase family protein [Nocardioides panacis]|uniref:Cryptochrome/photolyase family protein n=1 Tax=Nocardioides panacis TaxID=2849501 RepID=A0A975SXE4_9ACTN|nr:cryptochrome/photolyase family protein [Nocardioides panacis]QWZ07621.1 cryptochrome/photolyase family protein [Nocardioides panacis]